jgi:hypothetical protein
MRERDIQRLKKRLEREGGRGEEGGGRSGRSQVEGWNLD